MSDHTLDFIREALVGLNTQAEQRNQIEAAKLAQLEVQTLLKLYQSRKDKDTRKALDWAEDRATCLTALALKENTPEDSPND